MTVGGKALRPTPANLKYATRLVDDINRRIQIGTFDYAEFFPDSKRITPATAVTFGMLADQWLESKGQLAAATRSQYAGAVEVWKRLLGATTAVRNITHATVASKIGGQPWASAKLVNNYLIALRGIFALEYTGRRSMENPMIGIENMVVVKKLPDPLTGDERDSVLADMAERYDPRIHAYFTFAFTTGMRPEEQIALGWENIDWNRRTAKVSEVRTFKGSTRQGSKTHAEREVLLVESAMTALRTMQAYTAMKRDEKGKPVPIFENPKTRKPWHDERSQRDHYWAPTLRRLGIRARRAYATRHTYATTCLMAGLKPAFIAHQLGHVNTSMLFRVYARWIDGADHGREAMALEAAFGGNSSQQRPKKEG